MDFHYDPLLAIFDGWIVLLMVALSVTALLRLRGTRRLMVGGGFVLCAVATVLWLPLVSGTVLVPLLPLLGPDLTWQAPALPWTAGMILIALGIFLRPPLTRSTSAAAPLVSSSPPPVFPPPASGGPVVRTGQSR